MVLLVPWADQRENRPHRAVQMWFSIVLSYWVHSWFLGLVCILWIHTITAIVAKVMQHKWCEHTKNEVKVHLWFYNNYNKTIDYTGQCLLNYWVQNIKKSLSSTAYYLSTKTKKNIFLRNSNFCFTVITISLCFQPFYIGSISNQWHFHLTDTKYNVR